MSPFVLLFAGCGKATPPPLPVPTANVTEERPGPPTWPVIDEPEIFQVSRCDQRAPVDGRVEVNLRWPAATQDVTYRVLLWGWHELAKTTATQWEGFIPTTGDSQITDGPWAFTVVAVNDAGLESEPQGIWGCEALTSPPRDVESSVSQDAVLRAGGSMMELLEAEAP